GPVVACAVTHARYDRRLSGGRATGPVTARPSRSGRRVSSRGYATGGRRPAAASPAWPVGRQERVDQECEVVPVGGFQGPQELVQLPRQGVEVGAAGPAAR